jgi:hypothetical protein
MVDAFDGKMGKELLSDARAAALAAWNRTQISAIAAYPARRRRGWESYAGGPDGVVKKS